MSILAQTSRSVSVIVPAYNEENTLHRFVSKLAKLEFVQEIIIVDDCSKDNTHAIAMSLQVEYPELIHVLKQPRNFGKTEALKAGFAASTGSIVIVQDADLEYDPDEIEGVVGPIRDGVADVVLGSRFLIKKAARVLYYYHYLANKLLTTMSNILTNLNLTDVETGYKAFRGEIIRNMIITSSGFGFEIEVMAKVAKLRCAIYEVPISYYGRTYEEGKKIGMKDGIAALWYLVLYNLFCSLSGSFRTLPQALTSKRSVANPNNV